MLHEGFQQRLSDTQAAEIGSLLREKVQGLSRSWRAKAPARSLPVLPVAQWPCHPHHPHLFFLQVMPPPLHAQIFTVRQVCLFCFVTYFEHLNWGYNGHKAHVRWFPKKWKNQLQIMPNVHPRQVHHVAHCDSDNWVEAPTLAGPWICQIFHFDELCQSRAL